MIAVRMYVTSVTLFADLLANPPTLVLQFSFVGESCGGFILFGRDRRVRVLAVPALCVQRRMNAMWFEGVQIPDCDAPRPNLPIVDLFPLPVVQPSGFLLISRAGRLDPFFLPGTEMFKSPQYEDISLAEWMAHTPHLLMDQDLGVGMSTLDSIPKQEMVIVPV